MGSDLQSRVQMMIIQLVPFFLAIVFHEFGHGFMAKKFGDRTATDEGRLTLNPMAHIDPIGTLAIPLLNMITGIPLLFGWAKPVPINPNRFSNYRKGLFWVSVAGPMSNVLLATFFALVFALLARYVPQEFSLYEPILSMAYFAVQINFGLALFNLLPLPPLDGGKVLESFLGYNATQQLRQVERYSFFILLALLWTGALSFLSGPIIACTRLFLGVASAAVSTLPF